MASETPVALPVSEATESAEHAEHVCGSQVAFPTEVTEDLSNGFMNLLEPDINQAQVRLQELLRDQEMLLEKVKEARECYKDRPEIQEIISVRHFWK